MSLEVNYKHIKVTRGKKLTTQPKKKKMDSSSGGHISVKSKPIFKNHMRSGIAKKFSTI